MDTHENGCQSLPRKAAGKKHPRGGLKRHLSRLLCILLVIALASGALVYKQTDVAGSGEMTEKLGAAAGKLLDDSRYIGANRLTRMVMYARYVLSRNDTYEDYVLGADICIAGGDYAAAAELTLGAISKCGAESAALADQYLRAGYLYTLSGDTDAALEYLASGLRLRSDPEALSVKAMLHAERGEEAEAKAAIERCAALCGAENADMAAGNTALRVGAYEAAETIFTLLCEAGNTDALLYRGVSLYSQGKYEAAEADFDLYIARGGSLAAARLIPAQGRMKNGDYAGALALFESALSFPDADRKTTYYYMALCAYHSGDNEAALANARACFGEETAAVYDSGVSVELKSADERELNKIAGAACLNLKMYDTALEYFDRYFAANEEDTSADSELRATVEAIRLELKNR